MLNILIKWSDPLFLTKIYLLEIFSYVDSDPYYGMPLETKKTPKNFPALGYSMLFQPLFLEL